MKFQEIPGWMDFADIYLDRVKKAFPNSHFVEVGTWLGQSAAYMAELIKITGKTIKFDVVDTFKGNPLVEEHKTVVNAHGGSIKQAFINNMKDCGVLDYINAIHEMDSVDASKLYLDNSLDFVFIDADHEYESVKKDILAWFPKIKTGGMIAGDDYDSGWPGVDRATHELFGKDMQRTKTSWIKFKN